MDTSGSLRRRRRPLQRYPVHVFNQENDLAFTSKRYLLPRRRSEPVIFGLEHPMGLLQYAGVCSAVTRGRWTALSGCLITRHDR